MELKTYKLTKLISIKSNVEILVIFSSLYEYHVSNFLSPFRLGQACAHIGALLLVLAELVADGIQRLPDGPACTDVLCKWTQPKGNYLILLLTIAILIP